MPKKTTKKVNIAVESKKQGYWVNKENLRKGERTIKAKENRHLVKRNRSGYDYSKTITGFEWTIAELQKELAKRAEKGLIEQKSIARDLAHTHRITKTAPIITAEEFFSRDEWFKQDILGVDTPPGMTLKEIQELYKDEKDKPKTATVEKTIFEKKKTPSSDKRFIIKNNYADKNIGFSFEGKEVLDFSIINCTPDEEHKLMIDRGYATGKTEMSRRWTKKGEKLNIFKITTSKGTEYVASLESDPKAYSWKTFGNIEKKSFDTITEAKQWLSKKTSIPRKNFATDRIDLKELENIRPELGIKFDNLRSIKKTSDSSEMKDILVKDAESTYNTLISRMNIIEYNTDIAIRDASKPITSKEVINKLLQDAKGRKETLETQSEWIGDTDFQKRRAYEKERLPVIIKALKDKGKYPELLDSHKFRSNAQLQEEYYLTLLFDPDFKKGEMQIAKMKDEIPKSEIELLKAQNITHRYTLNEQFDKAKKPENKNAKFVKDLIAEEKKVFQSYVDGRSENAIENARNYNERTKNRSIEKQKQHISYLNKLYDSEDITEAYEYRQKQNERTPEGQYNRVNRLGNDLRALGEEAEDLQNNVKNQKEHRNKKSSFDRGMKKLTATQKEKDLSETADITIQAVNEETFEVWEKQPLILDMKGYDDVEGQEPPPRFTLNKAKKYLKELGADPDKLDLSEYGTISYAGKRIGSIDMRSPRSEQLRREIVRGVSWGEIPVKEMKRKVILNKKEKALLNSLGDYSPSAKELDAYLTGDIAETKQHLKQLEEKGLIERNKDNTYSTTNDGRKIQQMMNKLPTPIKPKEVVKPLSKVQVAKPSSQDEITKQDYYSMDIRTQNAIIKKNIHRLYYEKYGEKCNIGVVGSTGTATGNVNLRGTTDQEKDFLWKELKIGPIVLSDSKLFWMNKLSKEGKLQDTKKKEPVKKTVDISGMSPKELSSVLDIKKEIVIKNGERQFTQFTKSTAETALHNMGFDKTSYAIQELEDGCLVSYDYESKNVFDDFRKEDLKKKFAKEGLKVQDVRVKTFPFGDRVTFKVEPAKPKTKPDVSKSIAAGKLLYSEKYDPNKTHLALTKTMTDMQKRRLIKMCKDSGVDTKELDSSLKYDENQEIINHMIELDEEQMRDERAKVEQKIQSLEGTYYGGFSKKRIKERALDEKTTEPTVITEEDLRKKRKKKQLAEWEDEPYISKIDVEDIDTKKFQETQQEKREREFMERLARGEVKLATKSPKEQLQDIGSNLPKAYDGRYRGTMVEFDKTIDYLQKNKNEIIGLTDLTSKDFDELNKGSRADQMQKYSKVRTKIWSSYYQKD